MNTQKLKANWLKAMAAACAALMVTGAHGAEKITVDEVTNHYPWDGKVDCVTTLNGLETSGYKYEGVFTLSVKKDGAKVSKVVTNAFASANGTYTNAFDCAALFGAGLYPNGGIAVDLVKNLGGVQLWADGPYWAECNVGASKPEEYGYYFWWGDTVGYTNNGSAWISVKDGTTTISFSYNSSSANSTAGKDIATLISASYIDSATSNLVAKYDAATAHLGGPWRMPTSDEIQALVDNCNRSWTNDWNGTGVAGYVVTGKDVGYTGKSIFLPAAGFGFGSDRYSTGSFGDYWSSTPNSDDSDIAWNLYFVVAVYFDRGNNDRYNGMSVRPLRTTTK